MFGTSASMRSVIFNRIGHSICSMVAVIASTVFTARMMTGQSYERALLRTPTDLKSGTTVKYCHTVLSRPAFYDHIAMIAMFRPQDGMTQIPLMSSSVPMLNVVLALPFGIAMSYPS